MNTILESIIQNHAEMMADKMVEVARWAKSEEDVRYECNKLIRTRLGKPPCRYRRGGIVPPYYVAQIIEDRVSCSIFLAEQDPSVSPNGSIPDLKPLVEEIARGR
jgi:hypothetical protein